MLEWPVLRGFLQDNARRDLRMVELTGGGEPLAYNWTEPLLETFGELGILIEHLNTNATLLPRLADRLVDVGLSRVTLSLNESDPKRYPQTMKTSQRNFAKAVEGVRAMVTARDAASSHRRPKILLQLFIWHGSARYIGQMYELARSFDVDRILFRTIFGHIGNPKIDVDQVPSVKSQLRDIIRENCESGEYKLHFDLSNEHNLHHFTYAEQKRNNMPIPERLPSFERADPRTEYCFVGWYTTSINALGYVYPCFQYHTMAGKEVGNILTEPLDEIWTGESYGLSRDQIHELMRLRGRMEASDRFNRYVEPKCTDCDGCQFTTDLMTPDFYARVARGVENKRPVLDRFRARGRNAIIHGAHRLLRRPRQTI